MKVLGLLIGTAVAFVSTSALAKCDKYGNCYYGSGSGFNSRTGSSWIGTNDSRGSRGIDSDGNYYQYNRGTGSYFISDGEYRYNRRR